MESALAAKATDDAKGWAAFERAFRAELGESADAGHVLDVLATMSRASDLAIGCYREDERRCHRSIPRSLLTDRGARLVD